MDAAEKFMRMLEALVGEEEMAEMKIEHAALWHESTCTCEECEYYRDLLFNGYHTGMEEGR